MPIVMLTICQSYIKFSVDNSGAEVDIIDEETFKKLRLKPKLNKCNKRLYTYSKTPIPTLGEFSTRVATNQSNYRSVTFIVTKGNSGNLISYRTAVLLNIMKMIQNVQTEHTEPKPTKWHQMHLI
jgi:hypothetical protein